MKLTSFVAGGTLRYGIVTETGLIDLSTRLPSLPGLRQFIAHGDFDAARDWAGSERDDFGFEDVAFAPVIPDPEKIICIGLNYHAHVRETGREATERPALFARYAASQVGHLQPMVKPLESDKFDYEGELAVVIGKGGRRISEADALAHVAGYSCYNDGSVRDWQNHTSQFMAGKTFAGTGAFGPWLVTADEIPDPSTLRLTTRLNGEMVQDTTLDLLITSTPRLIAYVSTILPLAPGDVLVSGTPGGVGFKRQPPLWMKDGDVVEVEISGIGTLRNPVLAERA